MPDLDRTYPPQFVSGTIAYDGSTAQSIYALNVLERVLTQAPFTGSDGQPWWSVYDAITTGSSYDKVFISRGNRELYSGSVQAGDTRIFLQLRNNATTQLQLRAFVDWSTNTSTGRNQSMTVAATINATADGTYVIWADEYEFLFFFEQYANNVSQFLMGGQPIRTHVPQGNRGRCFTTQEAAAGSSVTVNIDRNMIHTGTVSGSLTVGAPVWIVAQTTGSSVTSPYTYDITTIEALTTNSITFANLNNSYSASALVGADPIPTYSYIATNLGSTRQGVNKINGEYISTNLQQHQEFECTGYSEIAVDHADGNNQLYLGSRVKHSSIGTNGIGQRGTYGFLTCWPQPSSGNVGRSDFFRDNYDNGKLHYASEQFGAVGSFRVSIPVVSGSEGQLVT